MEDEVSRRIKEEIELHNIESQFGPVVKFFNLFFFGNGRYWQIPTLWATVSIFSICAEYAFVKDGLRIIYFLSVIAESVVNLYFGYKYTYEQQLTKMIYYYNKKYKLDVKHVISLLNYGSIVNLLFVGVVASLTFTNAVISYVNSHGSASVFRFAVDSILIILSDFIVVGASIYLCIMWCLQMHMLQLAFDTYFLNHLIRIDEVPLESNASECEGVPTNETTMLVRVPSSRSAKIISPFHRSMTDLDDTEDDDLRLLDAQSFVNNLQTFTWRQFFAPQKHNFPTVLKHRMSHHHSSSSNRNVDEEEGSREDEVMLVYHQQHIEKKIFFFLKEMKELSEYWQMNHFLRAVTGLIIVSFMAVEFYLSYVVYGNDVEAAIYGLIVIIYYAMIWLTALSAGSVNDFIFGETIHKLVKLYSTLSITNYDIDRQISQTVSKLTAIVGMEGIHFAGIVVSMEKAISVGSILASLLIFCVNYFCSANFSA